VGGVRPLGGFLRAARVLGVRGALGALLADAASRRWRRRLERVLEALENHEAVVFEVYLDARLRPRVELKRAFPSSEEAVKYVREGGYLDEEGEVLDPREFLLYLKHASRIRVPVNTSLTTVLIVE
jgi:hypothetical protein